MIATEGSQRERLMALFATRSILRASELKGAGITPASIARAVEDGELERLSRGLYQRCRIDPDDHHALAVAAMRVPRGVVAMISALAFHGLTQDPHHRVWMAIGPNDWAPAPSCPPLRIVRFGEPHLRQGIEHHAIGGVNVPVYSADKTLVDVFRHPRLVDRSIAVKALQQAVARRSANADTIAELAHAGGVGMAMRPYLHA